MKLLSNFLFVVALSSSLLSAEGSQGYQGISRYHLPLTKSAIGPDIERKCQAELSKIGEELSRRFDLCFLSNGGCCFFTRTRLQEYLCTLSFYSQKRLTLDESKALAQSLLREYRQRVIASPLLVRLITDEGNTPRDVERDDFITYCLGLKITFWNDEFEYIPAPYTARIDLFESNVKLYQLLPTSPYLQVVSEGPLVLK